MSHETPPPPSGGGGYGDQPPGGGYGDQPPGGGYGNQPPGGGYGSQPPGGYGQGPYGSGQPQKNSGMAIAALTLGIIGVIPCLWGCLIPSILGAVFGHLGKRDVRESQGAKKGEALAQWGFILGLVGVGIGVLYWILFALGVFDPFTQLN